MPRKKDWAEKQTDQMLSELEGRINDEYSTAYKELSEKCDKYFLGFEKRDAVKLSQVSAGQISQEEYTEWRKNQMLIGQRWSDMVDTMAKDLTKVDQKVISMTRGFLPEAYALNHNYGTYEGEKSTHVDTAYTLYDRHTVERLLRDQPNMLPALKPNSPTARKLAERKDLIWNKQHLNSAITQGVLQGDDLKSVSKRLQSVTDMDNKAAKRNARTMMTGAQNAGRLDSYKRMQDMGIEVQKQWMATLDHYTRSSHAHLDGERADIDKKFANGLKYPGDRDGRPEEVYNCRCTMIGYFPEYPYENMQRYDNIEGKPIDEVTYSEWAGWKEKTAKNPPIDHRKWIDNVYSSRYSEKDRAEIAQMYSEAPYEVQQFYDKYAQDMNPMDDNGYLRGKAWFNNQDEQIHLSGKRDIEGDNLHVRLQTSSHEFAHNMDYLAGEKNRQFYLSQQYRDKNGRTFDEIIKDDWNEYFAGRYNDVRKKNVDLYWADVWDKVSKGSSAMDEYIKDVMLNLKQKNLYEWSDPEWLDLYDEYKEINGSDVKYIEFFIKHKEKLSSVTRSGETTVYEGITRDMIKEFCGEMRRNYSMSTRGDLSDMFELYSIEHGYLQFPFGVGHGLEYAKRDGALAKEAFAEMMDSTLANKESLELIKTYLPNAYNAFLDMIGGAVNGKK